MSSNKRFLAVLPALALSATLALAQEKPKPAEVNQFVVEALVKYTIIAVDQANLTGNYTVLRELGTPEFQKNTSTAMLADAFARLRQIKLEMSAVLLFRPKFTSPPVLKDGVLRVAGVFPTSPTQIAFQVSYKNVDGRMRLSGLRITPVKAAAAGATTTTSGGKVDKNAP